MPKVMVNPGIAGDRALSIPFNGGFPLAIRSHFFEFVDSAGRIAWPQLQTGQIYSVVRQRQGCGDIVWATVR